MRCRHEGDAIGNWQPDPETSQAKAWASSKKKRSSTYRWDGRERASTGSWNETKCSEKRLRNLDFMQQEKKTERGEDKDGQTWPSLARGPVPFRYPTQHSSAPRASSARCSLAMCHLPPALPKHQPQQSIQTCWWHLLGRSTDTSGFSPCALVLSNAQLVPTSTRLTLASCDRTHLVSPRGDTEQLLHPFCPCWATTQGLWPGPRPPCAHLQGTATPPAMPHTTHRSGLLITLPQKPSF